MSKHICESLGGTISIVSRPNVGTNVRFTMKVYHDLKLVQGLIVSSGSGEQSLFAELLSRSKDEQLSPMNFSPSDDSNFNQNREQNESMHGQSSSDMQS